MTPRAMSTRSSLEERFFAKVTPGANGCWIWTGACVGNGYGHFRVPPHGRREYVHRIAYEMLIGDIPDGLELDHICRVRACVNPWHLEPVTHRENVLRGRAASAFNAVKTHCPQGHPYDDANTYRWRENKRRCRVCNAESARRFRARRRAVRVLPQGRAA